MHRKDFSKDTKKPSSSALKKKEKESRRLQQELQMEKDKYGQMATKYMRENADLQGVSYESREATFQVLT